MNYQIQKYIIVIIAKTTLNIETAKPIKIMPQTNMALINGSKKVITWYIIIKNINNKVNARNLTIIDP